jgi:hypothetical protein
MKIKKQYARVLTLDLVPISLAGTATHTKYYRYGVVCANR